MIIIKLGGAVFAPKNSTFFDRAYLQSFYGLLKWLREDVFFIHWAGNVWHSFVAENWLNRESFQLWRAEVRKNLWNPFADIFPDFQRIEIEDLLKGTIDIKHLRWNSIVGGDISTDFCILSGDEAFGYVMHQNQSKRWYMVTDIDGILDSERHLIQKLPIWKLDTIEFWKKEWDVQNSMFTKVSSLKKFLENTGSVVWIMHGNNLKNIEFIVTADAWIGTKIIL